MANTKISLIIFFAAEDGEVTKNKTWSYRGSDCELLVTKFRLKLKKESRENH